MRNIAPFPYFGSKAAVADDVWLALGTDVPNYIEPFCGSCAVLWARPTPGKIETVNDAHCFIPNFLRAIRAEPERVAEHALWPVSEIDMHARHVALLARADEDLRERLRADASYYDAEMAGWWVWGASIWIGSGWCDSGHRNAGTKSRPHLGSGNKNYESMHKRPAIGGRGARPSSTGLTGVGIMRQQLPHLVGPHNGRAAHRKVPHLAGKKQLPTLSGGAGDGVGYGRGIFASGRREDLVAYFRALSLRLQSVRIVCGDFRRVLTPAVTVSHGLTAVFLDPPYSVTDRTARLYAKDSLDVAGDARAWALEHGDNRCFRIALCGYEGEHDMPDGWRCFAWKAGGGYGNQASGGNDNSSRERIWFSPYCMGGSLVAGPLFEGLTP